MSIREFFSVLSDIPTLLAVKKGLKPRPNETKDSIGLQFSTTASKYPTQTAVIFENTSMTWKEWNTLTNRYAHVLQERGIERGDVVSIMITNRPEFICALVAVNKLGATAALINTNLVADPLRHCIQVTGSKLCLFGTEVSSAINGIRNVVDLDEQAYLAIPDSSDAVPDWAHDFSQLSTQASAENPPSQEQTTLGETAFYVFTSGTTGLPKAAIMTNRRFLLSATLARIAGLRCTHKDRIYLCLPLYHTTGLVVGFGSSLTSGAVCFIRRRFSSSNFLKEIREHNITHMIYVGELLRYLMQIPEQPEDHNSPLHTIMGNGLRPDLWDDFKKRYGIYRITELYGASEANFSFANILNKDRTIGLTATKVALIKYDVENDEIIRDSNNLCVKVPKGETGLCLGHINPNAAFEGYTDKSATESKILRNVFEKGDAWFNTGDLLKTIDVGFALNFPHYQFVDRVGDTFRWKSENVSTNEVAEVLNKFDEVAIANVFGVLVPGFEGRAGMAAINLNDDIEQLNVDAFSEFVNKNLPYFARPVFVRVQPAPEMTSTFKVIKNNLRDEGYDVGKVADPIFVLRKGTHTYAALDQDFFEVIQQGTAEF